MTLDRRNGFERRQLERYRKRMKIDRRSGQDRRSSLRHRMIIDLEFEDAAGRHPGTLSDISDAGCFILSSTATSDGDHVKVFLPLSAGMKVQFAGTVANQVQEIGFAVKFDPLTNAQADFMGNFIDEHENRGPESTANN